MLCRVLRYVFRVCVGVSEFPALNVFPQSYFFITARLRPATVLGRPLRVRALVRVR